MAELRVTNLGSMLEDGKEELVRELLFSFSCPKNPDIETFLHHRAIDFAKQGIAATHLATVEEAGGLTIVGYYTLASKVVFVAEGSRISNSLMRKVRRFSDFNEPSQAYVLPLPLIAQFGKNFSEEASALGITGTQLMANALNTVQQSQRLVGGKGVFLECEDVPALLSFYENNGFRVFGERMTTDRGSNESEPRLMHQLIRFL